MSLYQKHKSKLDQAVDANRERTFYAAYDENPRAYGAEASEKGKEDFQKSMNENYEGLLQGKALRWEGEEVSPYLQLGLGIRYPIYAEKTLVDNSSSVYKSWNETSVEDRAGILIEALDGVANRFFEMAHATMHTTGQAFVMSFQASGPHANDRALEAIAMGYEEIKRFPLKVDWVKDMGKYQLKVAKKWRTIGKGPAIVVGCSTFPTWNSVPGMFASLITGNPVIIKPHPKSVYPIAIVVEEVQKVLKAEGMNPLICQLAVDSGAHPLAKDLAENPEIKLIDYTGGPGFGNYLESLRSQQKEVFTEKAGVNSVIIDSCSNFKGMMQNLAFSVSLYSGQMCTAPQNFYIPEGGIETDEGHKSFDEVVKALGMAIEGVTNHPKMGSNILGSIQNEMTLNRVSEVDSFGVDCALESVNVSNAEFENARTASPKLLVVNSTQQEIYEKELFGPVSLMIKTKDVQESIQLASSTAARLGAISCAAYSTDEKIRSQIEDAMSYAFTPVSFNLYGGIFVNQNAAFSDFHVTGGNPAGNASFTDPEYVNKRFVWVGHRTV